MLSRGRTTGDLAVGSIIRFLKPGKARLRRGLKWIVIANAALAAIGILAGGSGGFVVQIHGTSFLLVITAASLVAIEQGRFRSEIKYLWHVGSACSIAIGVISVALVWGLEPPDAFARPVGSLAVVAVGVTYCAVISVIADRVRLRIICWAGALGFSCYVLALIWFDIGVMPGRLLALMAVGQTACSLLAVIDFIASRRVPADSPSRSDRKVEYCPYCGSKELTRSDGDLECKICGGQFRTLDK